MMDSEMEGMKRPPMFIAENRPRVKRTGPTVHRRPASGPRPHNAGSQRIKPLLLRGGPVAGCTRDKCWHRGNHGSFR